MAISAAQHLRRSVTPLLAVVGTDDHLTACVPIQIGRYWQRVPVRTALTWQHGYSFLGTPLLDRDEPVRAAAALLDLFATRAGLLALDQCPTGGAVHDAFATAAVARGTRVHTDWVCERAIARASDTHPVALRGKHLKELRRIRRKLEAALGSRLTLVERPADDATIGMFLKLEASGWKGDRGSALACGDEEFFRAMCTCFAKEDRVRFYSLENADEIPVAMLCAIRSGDIWYWFKIAFDEHYATSSPGRQLMLDVTAQLCKAPEETVLDSCADPQNETINQLWTGRRRLATLLIPLTGRLKTPVNALAAASARRHQGQGEQR